MYFRLLALMVLLIGLVAPSGAAEIVPTYANVRYGPHERQVLDFYQAKSPVTGIKEAEPAETFPVLFFIHSGGWNVGDKARPDFLELALKSGVSVVSINYRYIQHGVAGGIKPPVKAPLEDAALALQFTRSQAQAWKIDKQRIALCGASAGGFSALWLAYHDDMADPKSENPVQRESTRVTCVMAFVPQTTLDLSLAREWIPNNNYGYHAFGIYNQEQFLKQREELLPFIQENSPYSLATRDDPPTYLFYGAPPEMGKPQNDPPHSANWSVKLAEKLRADGVECEFSYPGAPDVVRPNIFDFFKHHLKVKTP
ncbi:Esterase/lipase-like protein [Planctopirus limnophila DSM 3776]|uniref:Esterase/lipase-like protein n=1 Tax=Planctopirus limnophila (strain ATCC 43296 / DSM 3776 / IFAM 1008 / Mu 290) TaxID=521674 RepID=D5SS29_PLAL2|nr:alpha/beta hydrolase [Planctopirus limnophila]ADG68753.1 Esterase/lipase-like protein [Planctopirus limnophila DSM 3776]